MIKQCSLLLLAWAFSTAPLLAAPSSNIGNQDLGLTGNRTSDYWDEMTRERLKIPSGTMAFGQLDPNGPQDPYYGTFIPYILSQNRPSGARLYRTGGQGNVADKGLYDIGGMGSGLNLPMDDPIITHLMAGTITRDYLAERTDIDETTFTDPFKLQIRSAGVVENLETVVFSINILGMKINEGYVTPFEMTEMIFPVKLTLNNNLTLLPTFKEMIDSGSYSGGGNTGGDEAEGSETWAFQWDLRGIEVDIESFSVDFVVYPHSSTRGLRIDQSDTFTQVVAIPEPTTWLMMSLSLGLLLLFQRKRHHTPAP